MGVDISRYEQRVLEALAQGERIVHRRDEAGRIATADCLTREGCVLADCTIAVFQKIRRRGLIVSQGGGPYWATRLGLVSVRSQADSRSTRS